jgi:hypothetical protein
MDMDRQTLEETIRKHTRKRPSNLNNRKVDHHHGEDDLFQGPTNTYDSPWNFNGNGTGGPRSGFSRRRN